MAGGTPVVPQLASQMTVSGEDVNARPLNRPGEILETAPGLVVIQHSGEGKANQYYLRGWNLDHGTDLAVFVDDVPVNLPTHAHGQGYIDLNWLIPEAVNGVDIRKGPFYADVGDFENAGNVHISWRDTIEQNIASVTLGSFGYARYLALGSTKVGDGNLLYAGEFNTYNGPWTDPGDVRKFSGLLRYSQGTATDGVSVTAAAYANNWNSTDQVALRAITTGQIGLYSPIDPSDGGDTSRFSLSGRMAHSVDDGMWKANAYAVGYTLNLFSNFSWETSNPVYQDQFNQRDGRIYTGGGISRSFNESLFGLPTETVFGLQTRYDDINLGLSNTFQRLFLSNTLVDHVNEGNVGIYAENTVHWTDWWRTTFGWRGDAFAANVDSKLQPANSGKTQTEIGSPKFTTTFGPFYQTELFLGAGMGYHSNDARGSVATEVPASPGDPQNPTAFLARSRGAEVGVRTKAVPNLDSSINLFYIRQQSELFFSGDDGTTVAGPPSLRTGIEWTNDYRLASWLHIDGDLALSRARFIGFDEAQYELYQSLAGYPQAQIGNAPGNYVFNAPWMVASLGITLGDKTGWYSAVRWRYLGSRPLTEDGVFQSPPMNMVNARVGYRFTNGWSLQLDALNLLNSTTDLVTYAYGALLYSDALFAKCFPVMKVPAAVCQNGVMDYSLHPVEPLALRMTLVGPLETINVAAMADELKYSMPAYEPPAAAYDWTGFYIGAYVGDTWRTSSGSTVDLAAGAPSAAFFPSGGYWHGGIQFGFDYMLPSRMVIGIAGDVSSGDRKRIRITDTYGTSANQTNIFDRESVRARLGYALDSTLFYATGGWAWSNNQYIRTQLTGQLNLATAGTDEANNIYLNGWTAGAGIAVAFERNWNAFAEFRYTDYNSTTITLPFSDLSTTFKTRISEIDVGVNYKFDWNAPAVVKAPTPANPRQPAPALVYKAPPALAAYDWSGFYIGGEAGHGWAHSSGMLTTAAGKDLVPYSYGVNGSATGLFIGANYQFNRFVVGAEGDWQWAELKGYNQELALFGVTGSFPDGPFTTETTIKDYGSIRARLGVAFDRFLVYGTGGWAVGNPSTAYALLGLGPLAIRGGTFSGWTGGTGLEYAVTDQVLTRLEYRYTSLGTSGFAEVAANIADARSRQSISDLRAGLAYKFRNDALIWKD